MQLWVLAYTVHSSHYISCSDTYEKRPTNYEKQIYDNGMSIFRSVDVLVCRGFGLSTFWFVEVLVCRRFGLSTLWPVDVLVCRRFGLSTFWFVDVLVCRRFGLSTFRFVDVSVCRRFGCRRFGLSTFWPVTVHIVALYRADPGGQICRLVSRSVPTDTSRNNDVVIASKWRHFDVIASNDVVSTL